MMKEMIQIAVDKSKALESMKENLLKYKDAVVIIGNDAVKEAKLFHATEHNEKAYSRRNMVKNPKEYWNIYKLNIAETEKNKTGTKEQKALLELLKTGVVKTIIDVNYDGYLRDNVPDDIEYIQLKGDRRDLFCTKCNEIIPYNEHITGDKVLVHKDFDETSNCMGKVQPTVPHYGAKINKALWNQIIESIFIRIDEETLEIKTHAVILVGVDIAEDIVGDLIELYKILRGKNNLQHLLIAITYESPQLIDMLEAEFGTVDKMDESLLRLKELLEK